MGKKRDLANEHLLELIDIVVDLTKEKLEGCCPLEKSMCPMAFCADCKEKFLEEYRKELKQIYFVK